MRRATVLAKGQDDISRTLAIARAALGRAGADYRPGA